MRSCGSRFIRRGILFAVAAALSLGAATMSFSQDGSVLENRDKECVLWHSLVDETTDEPARGWEIDTRDPKMILKGIECLLKLEGNQNRARFGGAMNDGVSKIFIFEGKKNDGTKMSMYTRAEVAALYYVTYLFTGKFDHANAVALKDTQTGAIDSPDIIEKAYKSYRNWFEKIKEIGLEEARRQGLDPLAGAGVMWY